MAARPALLCSALLFSPPSNIHSLFNTFLDSSPALNYIGKESLSARPASASLDASRLSRALRARVRPLHHHDDDHVWGSNSLSFFLPPSLPPHNSSNQCATILAPLQGQFWSSTSENGGQVRLIRGGAHATGTSQAVSQSGRLAGNPFPQDHKISN